jgi:hypothetical protein
MVEDGKIGRKHGLVAEGGGGFAVASSGSFGPGFQSDAVGDAVEPGGEPVAVVEGFRLADEDEEGGLEGVVDVVGVAQEASANAMDEGSVAGDDGLERARGGLVVTETTVPDETLEELGVAQAGDGPRVEKACDRNVRHAG